MNVIALDTQQAASTATTWEDQGGDLTASARALGDIAAAAIGFTERVRPSATAFAEAWAALTGTLADECQHQGAALRTAASNLVEVDEAVRARLGLIGAA